MIVGYVRDFLPRVTLALFGREGKVNVEFILDTGFDGELCLPTHLLSHLDLGYGSRHTVRLADGSQRKQDYFYVDLEWNEEIRRAEVIATQGLPLLGNLLLADCSIHIDMTDGGEVLIEYP